MKTFPKVVRQKKSLFSSLYGCCAKFLQPLPKTDMDIEEGNSYFDHGDK